MPDPKKDDPTPKQRITLNWSENDEKGVRNWGIVDSALLNQQPDLNTESNQIEKLLHPGCPLEKHHNGVQSKWHCPEIWGTILQLEASFYSHESSLGEQNQCSVRGETVRCCQEWNWSCHQWGNLMLNILLWPFCKSFDEPKLKCQFLSDNINECDRNLIRLHDHLQDGTMGVPGSGQQVLHLHFISILWFCNSTKVYHHIHDRRKHWASHYTAVSSFHEIPIHFRSYLCTDAGSKPMHTELHRSDGEYFFTSSSSTVFFRTSWRWRCETDRCSSQCQEGPVGCIQVTNLVCLGRSSIESIFSFFNFRVGAPEGEFQISMDCTYRPNDVVPIIGKKLLIISKKLCFFWVLLYEY